MNHKDYGRTTITVPIELKKKMKQVNSFVNWSSVACEAFEEKIEALGPIEEIDSIEGAVERMKQIADSSAEESEPEASSSGIAAGKKWALNHATPEQLAAIAELKSSFTESKQWINFLQTPEGFCELTECVRNLDDEFPLPRQRGGRGRRGQGGHRPGKGQRDPENRRGGRRRRPRNLDIQQPPGQLRMVWRDILDQRPDHRNFFASFAEGANEIWDQLKDQL